ncbi:MAG: murein L,D-transpeptidase catalytic domain family protein [Chitinophagaceae bacterium]|nr:MAG: murein L,D-transpeptidase catalytic domain family protein [Chitinophagaceae bacterium]
MNLYLKSKSLTITAVLCCCISAPLLISGVPAEKPKSAAGRHILYLPADLVVKKSAASILSEEAYHLYESMKLKRAGLNRKVFEYAWKGYNNLLQSGKVRKAGILSICDFSQSSRRKRLYVIDVRAKKMLVNTYVAHGRNSGGEFANKFSNRPESHQSSLGFYVTRQTYFGGYGLALKIDGVERGINDRANERNIVVHGSHYIGEKFLRNNPFNGRSFGCPAIPAAQTPKVINSIKDGSCLFIYHPTKHYLTQSRILNG